MNVELAPHQKKAVAELKNGSILVGGTGVGKTRTALAYYVDKEDQENLIVITTAKKRDSMDWETEAIGFGIGSEPNATFAGTITVDSWNNIGKYEGVRNAFFIFDEQRLVGSGAWVKSFLKITPHNNWILLSATPGDTWLDYIPVFIANGFYKNRTEFKREHVVYASWSKFPKVERYLGINKLVRHRNAIFVEMPYERHTTRIGLDVAVSHSEELLKKVVGRRWNVYEERPLKNRAEMFHVMRRVVNSDPSRLTAVMNLMEQHPRLIVFYNFDYELEILRSLTRILKVEEALKEEKSSEEQPTFEKTNSELYGIESPLPERELRNLTELSGGFRTSTTWKSEIGQSGQDLLRTNEPCHICRNHGNSFSEKQDPQQKCLHVPRKDNTATNNFDTLSTQTKNENQLVSGAPSQSTLMDTKSNSEDFEKNVADLRESLEALTFTNDFAVAEWNGHKHEPIPTTKRWLYFVQYISGSESWNCTTTNATVFYSQNYSYRLFQQACGRTDRMNTPFEDLYYYSLVSQAPIDKAIKRALKHKENFNEKSFVAGAPDSSK